MIKAFEFKTFLKRKEIFTDEAFNEIVAQEARKWCQCDRWPQINPKLNLLDFLNNEFVQSMNATDKEKYTEILPIYNEKNKRIGKANYLFAMKGLLIHGAVATFLIDFQNQKILLQRRAPHLPQGDKWDPSSSGHLSVGKRSIFSEALRELREEIGINPSAIDIYHIRKFKPYRNDNPQGYAWGPKKTLFYVFGVNLKNPADIKFKLNPEEVTEVRWFSLAEIKKIPPQEISHALNGALLNIDFGKLFKVN